MAQEAAVGSGKLPERDMAKNCNREGMCRWDEILVAKRECANWSMCMGFYQDAGNRYWAMSETPATSLKEHIRHTSYMHRARLRHPPKKHEYEGRPRKATARSLVEQNLAMASGMDQAMTADSYAEQAAATAASSHPRHVAIKLLLAARVR